tara:strand:- start:564 stop:710 length:147 start_codon:yes stop_codon:yes gene_type:complete
MSKELAVILELTKKLRNAEKEIERLNKMMKMICEGYTFIKDQLPYKKQ